MHIRLADKKIHSPLKNKIFAKLTVSEPGLLTALQ